MNLKVYKAQVGLGPFISTTDHLMLDAFRTLLKLLNGIVHLMAPASHCHHILSSSLFYGLAAAILGTGEAGQVSLG